MRSWLLACFTMIFTSAAIAGPCADQVRLPQSSILLLEQATTGAPDTAPWIKRLVHPTDPRITVDLGLADRLPAGRMDRAYLHRTERGALGGAREIYREARAQLIDSGMATTPRWAWWVTSRKGNTLHHYRSDRFDADCALLAAIAIPASYESSGILERLNIGIDDLARRLVIQYGAPEARPDRDLPQGAVAALVGLASLIAMVLARLYVWCRRLSDRCPLDLAFRFGAALPLVAACGAVSWSLAGTILRRGKMENVEILFLVVVAGIWLTAWIGSRWQHLGTLCAILIPLQVVNVVYWLMSWHWDEQHFFWLLGATLLAAACCGLGIMKTRRDARLQLALDDALLDAIANSER
jgi:hypothetical protein